MCKKLKTLTYLNQEQEIDVLNVTIATDSLGKFIRDVCVCMCVFCFVLFFVFLFCFVFCFLFLFCFVLFFFLQLNFDIYHVHG